MWRVVGLRVGLPRHDIEVEGVAVKDDAVLELRVRCCTCNAQVHVPNEATIVFHEYFSVGCCDIRNLSASFARL